MTRVSSDEIFLMYAGMEGARALRQLDEVERLLKVRRTDGGHEVREWLSVFDAIRMALHFSANLSRIFWPPKQSKSAVARGIRLRTLTNLSDTHALATRKLRDHVEHMDERLDDWTANSPRPFLTFEMIFYDDMWGRIDEHEVKDATAVFFDEHTNTVQIFGDTFSLTDLRDNVKDVLKHVSDAHAAMYPAANP